MKGKRKTKSPLICICSNYNEKSHGSVAWPTLPQWTVRSSKASVVQPADVYI